jgi:hypothetical protein
MFAVGLGVVGSDRRSAMAGGLLALVCGVCAACSWPDPDKVDETLPDEPLAIQAGEPDAGAAIDWDRRVDGSAGRASTRRTTGRRPVTC